ncbi:MAG: transporter substrate-binding domain-containing protein [Rhizobiaceae bacterium]
MKLLASFLLAMFIFASNVSAEPIKFGIASEPYPTASYQDESGKWVGWEIDLIKAYCAEAKLDCEITPVPWETIFADLNAGKVDAIMSSITINLERMKIVDFTTKYCESASSSAVLALRASAIDGTAESIKGKSVGAQVGTTSAMYAEKHFTSIASKVKIFQKQSDAFKAVAAGEIDAVLSSQDDMSQFLSTEEGDACCEFKSFVEPDLEIYGDGLGIGVRKGDAELKAKLNAAIEKVKSDNRFGAILDPHTDPATCG